MGANLAIRSLPNLFLCHKLEINYDRNVDKHKESDGDSEQQVQFLRATFSS
jgi:hypothetical protein